MPFNFSSRTAFFSVWMYILNWSTYEVVSFYFGFSPLSRTRCLQPLEVLLWPCFVWYLVWVTFWFWKSLSLTYYPSAICVLDCLLYITGCTHLSRLTSCTGGVTTSSWSVQHFLCLRTKSLCSGNVLSPGQTGMVGHPAYYPSQLPPSTSFALCLCTVHSGMWKLRLPSEC